MPILKTLDRKRPPAMGTGYYLSLGVGESLEWPAPPSAPFDTISSYVDTLKDELHRVAIAMAQGVDNNAAAIGRSGESKDADANATQKILAALGKIVVLAWERTFDLVSQGRGESIRWQASGMDDYDDAPDLGTLIEDVMSIDSLKIGSPTLDRELHTRVAMTALGECDEKTRAAVLEEILAASLKPKPIPPPSPFGTDLPPTSPPGDAQPLPVQPGQDAAQQAARTSA
jgi:hypothetical protein